MPIHSFLLTCELFMAASELLGMALTQYNQLEFLLGIFSKEIVHFIGKLLHFLDEFRRAPLRIHKGNESLLVGFEHAASTWFLSCLGKALHRLDFSIGLAPFSSLVC